MNTAPQAQLQRDRIRWQPDAGPLLTTFSMLLLLVPARLVVGPLGGAGSPAQLVGLACLLTTIVIGLAGKREPPFRLGPVPIAMAGFCLAIAASYVCAMTRPLDGVELRAADRGVLSALGWLGVLVVASRDVLTLERLERLLRRLAAAGGALGALGVVQFITHRPLTNYIVIPGLSLNSELLGVPSRNGYARPAGTAVHPIEFGVVLTVLLPIALHFALSDTHQPRWRRFSPVVAIVAAIPISISRSALLGTVVVLAVLIPTWPTRRRRASYASILVTVGLVYALVPGLLGTLKSLFTGISTDDSALSRTDSYTMAFQFVERAPVFGRGFATFLPSYRILDNQFLGTAIETGVLGALALVLLFATGLICAKSVARRGASGASVSLGNSLAASVAAAACSFALFDALSFPQVSGLTFLVLGCTGALHRLSTDRVREMLT